MMSTAKPSQKLRTLVDSQHALRVYLDALLCETAFAEPVPDTITEPVAESVTESHQTGVVEMETVTEASSTVADIDVAPEPGSVAEAIIQPDWAQRRFQCLSFQVAGITFASPLEKLNEIMELKEGMTELSGRAPWMVGLLSNRDQNVQVVDLAHIAMPEERRGDIAPVCERARHVILIGDGRYGLAADSLSRVLTLAPDEVRWRSGRSRRPWLAGTAVEAMCAILDIDNLCARLAAELSPAGNGEL